MVQWVVIGAAAAIVLGGGAAVAAKVMGNTDPAAATSSTVSTTPTTSAASGDATTATATSSTTTDDLAAAKAALATCRTKVKAGDALARAAADSARHWGTHAGAEISLDAGRISYAQAEKIWAASKAPAAADLRNFAAARNAYAAVGKGCGTTGAATKGTSLASAASRCLARSRAQDAVARTGAAVNKQWGDHVAQMKTKATAAGPAYHQRWMNFVADSKPVLGAYSKDAAALAKAPSCA